MRLLTLMVLFWLGLVGHAMADHEKITFGYIEKATLADHSLTLSAKLDTGAKSASLNALNITPIDINGKRFLRFVVPSKEGDVSFQCAYVGNVNIKARTGEMSLGSLFRRTMDRPVVLMRIQLAGQERMIRVNLTNRKRFIYPLLLGREAIMAFHGVVDPQLKYTTLSSQAVKKT